MSTHSEGEGGTRGNKVPIRRMPFSERNLFPRLLALTAAGLLLAALPAMAKAPQAAAMNIVEVDNTGSTNTLGYHFTVTRKADQSGYVSYQYRIGVGKIQGVLLSRALTNRLFHDLDDAMPLTSLPVRHGMRSASFGTETYITYKGQKSPDLTLASDPRTAALKADIDAITKTLHLGNAPRRPIVIHSDR